MREEVGKGSKGIPLSSPLSWLSIPVEGAGQTIGGVVAIALQTGGEKDGHWSWAMPSQSNPVAPQQSAL